jgi:predicted DNA-binding transcriptional regulator AlpA
VIRTIIDEYIDQIKNTQEPAPSKPELMTLSEVALLFKVSTVTVYKWVNLKVLPPIVKIGGRCYFRSSQIKRIIEKGDGVGKKY